MTLWINVVVLVRVGKRLLQVIFTPISHIPFTPICVFLRGRRLQRFMYVSFHKHHITAEMTSQFPFDRTANEKTVSRLTPSSVMADRRSPHLHVFLCQPSAYLNELSDIDRFLCKQGPKAGTVKSQRPCPPQFVGSSDFKCTFSVRIAGKGHRNIRWRLRVNQRRNEG